MQQSGMLPSGSKSDITALSNWPTVSKSVGFCGALAVAVIGARCGSK